MRKHRLHTCLPVSRDLKKEITQIVLLSLACCFLSSLCYSQNIASVELINNAKLYDGKTVVYTGEVIGDIMLREDNAWINVNDGDNAIGIWIKSSLVRDVAYTGSYKSKGDVLEITGVFQRSCAQHGGDLDIHALAIKRITGGRSLTERLNPGKRNLVVVLLGILGIVWILKLLKRK